MRGRIFIFLFALPFFGVGVWMGYSIGANLTDAWQMEQWVQVQGTLLRAGYETHSGDDSYTYEAYADYTYVYGGQQYRSDRVAIAGGADNIGDYQQDLGRHLGGIQDRGESVVVYVDPDKPSEAILDRSLRWGLIGFKSIFLFTFGGVGLGLIIYVLRKPKVKDLSAEEYRDQPWLANDKWQTAVIKSDSKAAMRVGWAIAAFWNLVSAPLPFVIYAEVTEKNNLPALLGLLFPLVGVGLITWAVRRTLEWNRFGPAPLTLDPFPGSIGGHVGGTIEVNLPYDSNAQFSLTLSNLYSYVSGSGKNRSRTERAEWQDTQVAHVSSGAKGSRLSFRFDLPQDLSESTADQSEDSYYIWRLNLKADLPGVDIDRDYEIPVYATGESSAQLSEFSIRQARSAQNRIDVQVIEKLVEVSYEAGGRVMRFPMGRNLLSGFVGLIFGAIFSGVGWYLVRYEGHLFMGGVFGLVGLLIVISAFYFVLNSLEVVQEGGDIRTVRRILGIPVKRGQMRRADFVRFKKTASSRTQSGKQHVIRYTISALDSNGQELLVGEGFKGASQAAAAADFIGRQFGLTPVISALAANSEIEDYNLLAAD
ncbi:MAG: DUF3592 domain-containing protein [Proteobacteria bacterium]|nr:DUF3592 domain-containing protein [Pseudomonadota bacterium]